MSELRRGANSAKQGVINAKRICKLLAQDMAQEFHPTVVQDVTDADVVGNGTSCLRPEQRKGLQSLTSMADTL